MKVPNKNITHMTSQLLGMQFVSIGFASVCRECGQSFEVTQHAPRSTENSIRFCPFCGKPIDDEDACICTQHSIHRYCPLHGDAVDQK